MTLTLGMITIVVDNYERAISHYVDELGFVLIEDTLLDATKRWVIVAPGDAGARILIAQASNPEQFASIGKSTGGRVGFFLFTSDFHETYQDYLARGINFIESPRQEIFGEVVVFKDIYGNKWDLIEQKAAKQDG